MIDIFYDIIGGEEIYYVAEETEVKKGIKIFNRLCGNHRNRKEAENILKAILKERREDAGN